KALGLQTEASYRFERGTDYEGVRRAQDRCVALICELAGGTATEDALDVHPRRLAPPHVRFRPRRVEALTGLAVTPEECARALSALGFTPAGGEGGNGHGGAAPSAPGESMLLVAPTWRTDVSIEEDLVEEVARLTGYEKIKDSLPHSPVTGEYLPGDARRRSARRALTAAGFNEAVNISFIGGENEGRFELIPGLRTAGKDDGEAFVKLSNPIIEGSTLMRPTLLAGLLESVRHNFNHGTRSVRLFETGRVFAAPGSGEGGRPNELEAFALVVTGEALEAGRATGREVDFLDAKGALEAAVGMMNVGELEFAPASVSHLREGQSARVSLGGEEIGTLGRLSDETAALYKFRQPVFVAEVSMTALLSAPETPARYTPLPRFPSVVRDVSLLAERRVTYGEMRAAVLGLGLEHLRGVALVDVYEGAGLPEGKRSVTLRLDYRADDRTLRDEEVDEAHARAVAALAERFGAQLRG
ncbi:MAG TPA: phenylalanine--tRNA ligase subunit beta, partial [Pyrinomonadaceae bacterium]|nr:phenylalanine--tRNA ligase subunit beta [Pyrinomonadaceae bacterium]